MALADFHCRSAQDIGVKSLAAEQLRVLLIHPPPRGEKIVGIAGIAGIVYRLDIAVGGPFGKLRIVGTGIIVGSGTEEGLRIFGRNDCHLPGGHLSPLAQGRRQGLQTVKGPGQVDFGTFHLGQGVDRDGSAGLAFGQAVIRGGDRHGAEILRPSRYPGRQLEFTRIIHKFGFLTAGILFLDRRLHHLDLSAAHSGRHRCPFARHCIDDDDTAPVERHVRSRGHALEHDHLIGDLIGDGLSLVGQREGVDAGVQGIILREKAVFRQLDRLPVDRQREIRVGAALEGYP